MKSFNRLVLLSVALILLGCSNDSEEASPLIQYPQTQQNFFALNKACIEKFNAGQNEIQKSLAFNECNNERILVANQNPISGWVGTLTEISTSQGAERVFVEVEAEIDGVKIRFGNSSAFHESYNSRITPDKPIFNSLLGMKAGDKVIFSGNFMQDPESNSKLFEGGITEAASIRMPRFIIIFSDIRPFNYANNPINSEQKK